MKTTTSPFNPSYVKPKSSIVQLVPAGCRRILDVGCATGTTGARLKELHPGLTVLGVELDPEMAEVARKNLDEVLVGDISEVMDGGGITGQRFDSIILADVLEHVAEPWELLRRLVKHLEPGGTVITSIPNVRHYTTLLTLLFTKRWPYRDRGIHDRTHLRFFAQQNVKELFEGAGLTMKVAKRSLRIVEAPHRLNRFSWIFGFPPLRDLITFQYLIVGKVEGG
jgi:2-polyprenyl-3-methyl-5-hydroxy-6-metoxy-1,4-benzoquinol methylase